MTRARRLLLALLLTAAVISPTSAGRAFAQCAMCRANVENSEEAKLFSGELNRAILILFFAPYLVFGSVAAFLFRRRIAERWKAVARTRIRPTAEPVGPLPETP